MSSKKENKELREIKDSELEKPAGGYVLDAKEVAGVPELPYEVIDDSNGEVLGRYKTLDEAKDWANKKGQTSKSISYNTVSSMRRSSRKKFRPNVHLFDEEFR